MNRETKGTGGGMDWTDERKEKSKKKREKKKKQTKIYNYCMFL